MQVYIEYALLDNFIIDFLLLKISYKASRVKSGKLRLFIASVTGAIIAVLFPLLSLNLPFLVILKVLSGMLIVFIGGSYVKLSAFFTAFIYFLFFTFLSGGVIIAVFILAGIDYTLYYSLNYDSAIPIGVTVLFVYLSTQGLLYLIDRIATVKETQNFLRKCEVIIKGKKIKVNGYIDSGNKLYDELTGLPIIVASQKFIKNMYLKGVLPERFRTLNVSTVNGESAIKIFQVDKLLIYNGVKVNIYNNVLLGEAHTHFGDALGYELLLHSTLY